MRIAVTTDHAGLEQLQALTSFLESLGHEVVDFGPKIFDQADDYPDYIFPAAEAVNDGRFERAIIMGGSGQGEAIAANRFKNVRCALFYGPAVAKTAINAEGEQSDDPYAIVRLSRQHNDTNILSLGARFLSQSEVNQVCQIWLDTVFEPVERHQRRVNKLSRHGS
jgi:ribose 5-phosphate isomerase B